MSEEAGNGNGADVIQLHPEALTSLAQETARRQVSDRVLLEQMAKDVAYLVRWSKTVTNEFAALRAAHVAWPSVLALGVLFVGGMAGVLIFLLLKTH